MGILLLMHLRASEDLGHDFCVDKTFNAKILPEWRLATFSLVLPIPAGAGLNKFDFGQVPGWRYGRDKGVRTIENPQWNAEAQAFTKPVARPAYFGSVRVEGGRPDYNDARVRFPDPLDKAVGAASVDVDVDPIQGTATLDEIVRHEEVLQRIKDRKHQSQERQARDVTLAEAGWDERIYAHHFLFEEIRNETFYYLVNYDEQVEWEDQIRGERDSHGPATLRLLSAEVMQFHDLDLTDLRHDVPKPAQVTSDFLILNIAAENISSATLGFLSATLRKPRNASQVYELDTFYDVSPPQFYALTKFVNLAVAQIDAALGHETGLRISPDGQLVTDRAADTQTTEQGRVGTFTLPAPQRVVVAIPNPKAPTDKDAPPDTLGEGMNGSVHEDIDPPLVMQTRNAQWKWHEQWAWQILTGADSYPEQVPYQSESALKGLVAAQLSSWTIVTSEQGVGMVRTKSASREGMRYWSMAHTRFVDLVMLQMRAQAGETHLRKSLQIVGDNSASKSESSEEEHRAELRRDLERLEKLQLDHIEIRDKLWFRSVPGRDIDARVLKGLQRASGFDQLRDDFDSKVQSRQDVIRTQFEQLSGKLEEEEAKRAEAMNLVLGFVAAAIGAPDWAQAMGHDTIPGTIAWALGIFVGMFVLVWLLQTILRQWTAPRRTLPGAQ